LIEILDWKDRWPNFNPSEIACRGSGELKINMFALDCLQRLRNRWNRPIPISSGYRSPDYNAQVGGAPKSYHLLGQAFDVPIVDEDFNLMALASGFNGIGRYRTFVHLDTGPPRTWRG
jgi:uncharacterized protein YcbK (DUF882 family)